MNGLIEAIILEIIIPEVGAILRKKPDATDADVIAEFQARRDRIIAKGRTFLAETRVTDSVERTD